MLLRTLLFLSILQVAYFLLPIRPRFQWKYLDYNWNVLSRKKAISSELYIPEHNLPVGIARWRNKVFITVPRWKKGVPCSLNYVTMDGSVDQPLKPYPSWQLGCLHDKATGPVADETVVSALRAHVDGCDRLWVVDTGVADISGVPRHIMPPALVIFDLTTNQLIRRVPLDHSSVKRPDSFLTSITVEVDPWVDCEDAFAYISDTGANSLLVYSFKTDKVWRVDHPYFHFEADDTNDLSEGIPGLTLSNVYPDGHRDLYFFSKVLKFRMSTELLKTGGITKDELFDGLQVIGDKGSRPSACDMEQHCNLLFYAQVNHNGIGCWNTCKKFTNSTTPVIVSDRDLLEFPVDVKVDDENNLWILSNAMPRFFQSSLDDRRVNFRILCAPVNTLVKGTACECAECKHLRLGFNEVLQDVKRQMRDTLHRLAIRARYAALCQTTNRTMVES